MNENFDFLENRGKFRIVYLGGSITEGAGASDKTRRWSTQITQYLNSLGIGGTDFCEINAGIGGTNSAYGMMRLSRDVLSQNPQAVFIDFSLNDADDSESLSGRMYEGIIRKLMLLPCVPYVICIGVVPNRETEYKTELHKKIAAHYGLQYIDVREAMEKVYGKAAPGSNTARDLLFRPDNTHPVEAGYDFYTRVIKNELSEESFRRPEGEPMYADYCRTCGRFINASEFDRTGKWQKSGEVSWAEPNPGRKGESLASCESDAMLKLDFSGSTLLLGARFDRKAGKAELTLDGESRVCNLRYETDDQPVIILQNFELAKGEHTLTVRPAEGEIKIDFALISE